ncbi:related to lactose regulatory protein [Rhynchosporium graminicola]|uniref:Related to lactose regulatory protein n=1 Tax=Rhynchosporium graminicola TaxID=2792576 RepID=A0A1E1L9V0_9HELO|nr:related to lactose regulatory protein [Rhynchosporium commune]
MTNLNPTEDYKASVLCGLSPTVIMECASRALNFWAYQTTSEITYQAFLAKSLTDKYSMLNNQVDKLVHEANEQITTLQDKVTNMQADQESLVRRNEEIANALREKNRKHLQTQELYDKLKRRSMLSQVQDAASDEVDNAIQASVSTNHFVDKGNLSMRPPPPLFSGHPSAPMQRMGATSHAGMGPPHIRRSEDAGWNAFSSQSNSNQIPPIQTPSSHRQTLASLQGMGHGLQHPGIAATPQSRQRVSPRIPLANINGNNPGLSSFAGYGMSAGLKVSNPGGLVRNGVATGRPVMKPRGLTKSPFHLAHSCTKAL